MTRALVAETIRQGTDCSPTIAMKTANRLVAAWSELLRDNHKFVLANFGSFRVVPVETRQTINPQNGEPIQVTAGYTVRFKPSPALRRRVASSEPSQTGSRSQLPSCLRSRPG
jgi:DNA-binding protein HU-beta